MVRLIYCESNHRLTHYEQYTRACQHKYEAMAAVGICCIEMNISSFNAVCNEQTHTLLLGTMPGVASLTAHQYYAHKRNAFWPIMMAMLQHRTPDYSMHIEMGYDDKIDVLQSAGFGLWDVLAECERPGSLDASIKPQSVKMNDFPGLLANYKGIQRIAFNGKAAQQLFRRHALPNLETSGVNIESIQWISLPSSSPAMASLTLQQKYKIWTELLDKKSE